MVVVVVVVAHNKMRLAFQTLLLSATILGVYELVERVVTRRAFYSIVVGAALGVLERWRIASRLVAIPMRAHVHCRSIK